MNTTIKHPENVAQTQLDTRMAKAKPVKLGWTADAAEDITKSLNELLANYTIHYQRLRNYHWNVKGKDFFDLHIEFQTQYEQASQNIDEIAERIRVFDKTPLSTLQEYLDVAELKETGPQLSADLMVRELLSDYHLLLHSMFGVVEVSIQHSDAGTEQMVKRFIAGIEKSHWMLSAFMAK
jgi:starvation-inducible DNA-binding protein